MGVQTTARFLSPSIVDAKSASEDIQHKCDKVTQRPGYRALTIDLVRSYTGNDSTPKQALSQRLAE